MTTASTGWCTTATAAASAPRSATPTPSLASPPSPPSAAAADSYDNALAESTIGQIKTELIHRRRPWRTIAALEFAVTEYLDWWNHRRLHSEISGIPPAEKEALYYAQHPTPAGAGTQ